MKTVNEQIQAINSANARVIELYQNWVKKQGLNYSTFLILYSLLERDNLTQKELVSRTHLIKQTINNIMKELEKDGYIILNTNPDNKREKLISLTESGKEYAHSIADELLEIENRVTQRAGEDTLNQLIQASLIFGNILEEEMQ